MDGTTVGITIMSSTCSTITNSTIVNGAIMNSTAMNSKQHDHEQHDHARCTVNGDRTHLPVPCTTIALRAYCIGRWCNRVGYTTPSGTRRSRRWRCFQPGRRICSLKRAVIFFGWVFFLDFVRLTTRTTHGAYVRRARRNRIERHGGGIERLAACTLRRTGSLSGTPTCRCCCLPRRTRTCPKKSGNMFRVGIFLDFVWLTTRTPHGAYARRARRNRVDPHGGEIERLGTTYAYFPP